MIGEKLRYFFNQSESLFPRTSFATHDPQFALSFASTLSAVKFGHTVCSCRADTVFCYQCCVHGFVIPRKLFASPKGLEFEQKIVQIHMPHLFS